MSEILKSVSGEAAVTATTAEKAKTFTPITDAKRIASELVSRCVNNTMNGRVCGEIIPYYYCAVCRDCSYGLGISFHYDYKRGFRWEIHTVDKAKEYFDNEYIEYLNYVNEVIQWVDCYMEDGDGGYRWDDFYEQVKKYQISEAEAKEKTNWLFKEGSFMYV